jgi:diaminopimelate epimerase
MFEQNTNNSLWKAHGLGNDYLVWENQDKRLNSDKVRLICHRNLGVGSDGILEPVESTRANYGVTIWNPDGTVAEKSGNGLRIFAWWLFYKCQAPSSFSIDTGTEIVRAQICGFQKVRIDMGCPRFTPEKIPTTHLIWGETQYGGKMYAVGMGNPHCVVLFEKENLDQLPWAQWGAQLEQNKSFPNRTNVQFVRVMSKTRFELRVWERGAGVTLASGSSACAVFAVLNRLGLVGTSAVAVMPGGELELNYSGDSIQMMGPVCEIATIYLPTHALNQMQTV